MNLPAQKNSATTPLIRQPGKNYQIVVKKNNNGPSQEVKQQIRPGFNGGPISK